MATKTNNSIFTEYQLHLDVQLVGQTLRMIRQVLLSHFMATSPDPDSQLSS